MIIKPLLYCFLLICVLYKFECCPFARINSNTSEGHFTDDSQNKNKRKLETFQCKKRLVQTSKKTCSAYKAIKTRFLKSIKDISINEKTNIFAIAIRLVFHDAAEIDITLPNDLLGPDGCISNNNANNGLTEANSIVNTLLNPLWLPLCGKVSRADFWVMIAKLSVMKNSNIKLHRLEYVS